METFNEHIDKLQKQCSGSYDQSYDDTNIVDWATHRRVSASLQMDFVSTGAS